MNIVPESVWRERLARHQERLAPFANERLERMTRREKHPVRDFLFEYYAYRPAHLSALVAGCECGPRKCHGRRSGVERIHSDRWRADSARRFFSTSSAIIARWALQYLEGIAVRPPLFGCFGLHEWAMVYRTADVRHPRTPLRVSTETIAATVEAEELYCTHFDAYRFFTPAAVPRNRYQLSREVTDQFDQRGCVHVTMDLYRYAHKLSPWVSGELIADSFVLAWKARELDMRASPYDLTEYGLDPIPIERPSGKEEYVERQRRSRRKRSRSASG